MPTSALIAVANTATRIDSDSALRLSAFIRRPPLYRWRRERRVTVTASRAAPARNRDGGAHLARRRRRGDRRKRPRARAGATPRPPRPDRRRADTCLRSDGTLP